MIRPSPDRLPCIWEALCGHSRAPLSFCHSPSVLISWALFFLSYKVQEEFSCGLPSYGSGIVAAAVQVTAVAWVQFPAWEPACAMDWARNTRLLCRTEDRCPSGILHTGWQPPQMKVKHTHLQPSSRPACQSVTEAIPGQKIPRGKASPHTQRGAGR